MNKEIDILIGNWISTIVAIIILGVIILLILHSFGFMEVSDKDKQELLKTGKIVNITGSGWEEGSKVHHYIYPTDAGYVLNIPGTCDDIGCVGKDVIVSGNVYHNDYYKRNEMQVRWISVNGTIRGWF